MLAALPMSGASSMRPRWKETGRRSGLLGAFANSTGSKMKCARPLPAERQAQRQAQAPAIWAEMKSRAEQLQPLLLPKSSLGKAIRYFLHEYEALQIYLERPDYLIDNNLCENSIRPSCVGKRRWLFIGHPDAGWRSAVIYSIIQSCRRRGIDPQEYLTDVLGRLPANEEYRDRLSTARNLAGSSIESGRRSSYLPQPLIRVPYTFLKNSALTKGMHRRGLLDGVASARVREGSGRSD